MGKAAYFDMYAGCSGDMILGTLLDAGLPLLELEKGLGRLPLEGYRLTAEKVKRGAVTCITFFVFLKNILERFSKLFFCCHII